MKRILKSLSVLALLTLLPAAPALSQDYSDLSGQQVNIINTAVPFIGIAPDSRAGAMGNAGVATTPDVNSQHWNPAKFAFIDSNMGASMSYTPWLRKLVNDINMYYLTGFMRLDEMQTLSASLRYFTLGEIIYTQGPGTEMPVKPNEFALDVAYSRLLSEKFSGAVAFRYIRSDLNFMEMDRQPGNSFAADLAFYYRTPVKLMGESSELAAGINVSNIGNKISYDEVNKQFIPTNLRLGVALDSELDSYNRVVFTLDLNKLMVPTPRRSTDESGDDYRMEYSNMSVTKAMFQSFSDAPGGMKEELQEITYSLGAEYWYANQFALRAGYFHEHELKGNRKHFTAGVGIQFNMMTLDASYIIPVVADNPLANTIRFSLGIDLDQLSNR